MGDRPDTTVEVVPYDRGWPGEFETTRAALDAAVADVASSIEHIGSTAAAQGEGRQADPPPARPR